MSDIFISYKREEQATARKLADALEKEGWSVWWDPKLRAGEHFDDVIEKALNEAKCVIVIWSKRSVNSEYVKAEATKALEQKKLVPLKIENVNLPFRFKRVHTPTLLHWDGSKDSSEFRRLVEDIAAIVGSPVIEVNGRLIRRKKRSASQEGGAQSRAKKRRPRERPEEEARPEADKTLEKLLELRQRISKSGAAFCDKLKDGSQGPEIVLPMTQHAPFENDVFISYASLDDNQLDPNRAGWVSEFVRSLRLTLEVRLGREAVVWFDKQSIGSTENLDAVHDHAVSSASYRRHILLLDTASKNSTHSSIRSILRIDGYSRSSSIQFRLEHCGTH